MIALLLFAQSTAPDIELHIRATAREVHIEQSGRTRIEVRATPDGGSTVTTDAPRGAGRDLKNVTVTVDAKARIASPEQTIEQGDQPK